MSTVKVFSSTDPGAVALSGTAGSLIAVLDACLVTGHALSTPTGINVTASVATASYSSGHGFVAGRVALVEGATPAGLNGEKRVLSTTTNTITFAAPGIADGAATGSIATRLAPAGWAKSFTGTNLAAYRSSDVQGTRMFLRVNDTGAQFARVIGYENMTDINTGVGLFPTAVQVSGGLAWPKSDAASSAARPWVLIADSRSFYIAFAAYGYPANGFATYFFGDINAYRPGGDPFACVLAGSVGGTITSMGTDGIDASSGFGSSMPRAFTGLGSAAWHLSMSLGGVISGASASLGSFPSQIDGGLRFLPRYVAASLGQPPRGEFPGLLHVPQSDLFNTFRTGDRVQGVGALAGRELFAIGCTANFSSASLPSNTGASFIDATGPWR